jgi:hypothetical protein
MVAPAITNRPAEFASPLGETKSGGSVILPRRCHSERQWTASSFDDENKTKQKSTLISPTARLKAIDYSISDLVDHEAELISHVPCQRTHVSVHASLTVPTLLK